MIFPFLQNRGVLGINARNLLYVRPFNPRKAVAFADDKMKTKAFLSARGIPTARLYARIENRRQLANFDFKTLPDECVLKPNFGFGGEGIIILRRKNGIFLEQGKRPITDQRLREHVEDILDGKFSVNGRTDTAFFEQILVADDCFSPFRPAGLPDLRIIVFNLVPVMAMLRVPTAESGGKANVHLGGIGIGIDIAKGVTTHAVQYSKLLSELPHGHPVAGIEIPNWEEILLISSKIQYTTNIGYLAVDLTIDRELGPVLLEVNARAGLAVQIANLAPLRSRLERVSGLSVSTPEKGVRLAQELFGEKTRLSKTDEETDEKAILGRMETVEIPGDGFTFEEQAEIAPDEEETKFDYSLVAELKLRDALGPVEGSAGTYRVKFVLGEKKIQTIVRAAPLGATRIVVGRRDLQGFLIDPSKKPTKVLAKSAVKKDLKAIDRMLSDIDRKLLVLKYLRPINLEEEAERARLEPNYNPVFLQRDLPEDVEEIRQSLEELDADDSPLGILLRKKRRELFHKLDLLFARGDPSRFVPASLVLYGAPSTALIGFAKAHLEVEKKEAELPEEKLLTAEETKEKFEKILEQYGLHEWQVAIKAAMVSDCAVGEQKVFIREGAKFSESHVASLIAHEIETHVLTAENGIVQPYSIFRRGFANYLDTQEGLAIWNQNRVLPLGHDKRTMNAKMVLAVAYAIDHSFSDTRNYLERELGLSHEKALRKTIGLKRGFVRTEEPGAFTRPLVYFRGFRAIDQFVRQGGNMKKLYVGKIAIEDLPLIEKIEDIKAPIILPQFLRTERKEKEQKKQATRKSPQKR